MRTQPEAVTRPEGAARLQRYLERRRYWEVGLWVLYGSVNFVANVGVVWLEIERAGLPFERWEPVVWEGSSILVTLALVPAILAFDRYFPIARGTARRGLAAHALFTVPFSLAHVVSMVTIRKLVYGLHGLRYDFGHWPTELFYEYLKDFRSYAGLLAIIYLYRFVLRRLQGEAEFLSEGREEAEAAPVTDRFLVKKLGREFLVRVEDIDWIEASGNYVNLHVGGRAYPLRETMARIGERLAAAGFARVHRSAIVNLERVAELEFFDTGDGRARLGTAEEVPVSRRYRRSLRSRLERRVAG